MNKGDLVSDAAKRANLPASTVEAALNGLLESIGEAVKRGDKATLTGWISFEKVQRSARMARNPQTGEPVNVPARAAVKVKAGAKLKAMV
jgi:DNA-binding protein HU-beta